MELIYPLKTLKLCNKKNKCRKCAKSISFSSFFGLFVHSTQWSVHGHQHEISLYLLCFFCSSFSSSIRFLHYTCGVSESLVQLKFACINQFKRAANACLLFCACIHSFCIEISHHQNDTPHANGASYVIDGNNKNHFEKYTSHWIIWYLTVVIASLSVSFTNPMEMLFWLHFRCFCSMKIYNWKWILYCPWVKP